jgi:hypothetical protein
LGWVGHPVEVVADDGAVGEPDRREQRVLPLVSAVGGDVDQLRAVDAGQERPHRDLVRTQHLAAGPAVGHSIHLGVGAT